MSKIAIGLGSAMGIWTVGMGTTAISNGFRGSGLKEMTFNPKIVKLTTAEELKRRYMELPCIGGLFEKIEWNETQRQAEVSSFNNEETKGCISIWWEKETYDDGKWNGNWNLLWGMRSNVSGIIFSSKATTKEGKLKEETLLYTLKQENDKWTSISVMTFGEQEVKTGSSNNIAFPNEELIDADKGWDFGFYTQNICSKQNKCESNSPERTFINLNWNFINGNKPGLEKESHAYSWIKNIDTWLYFGTNIKTYLSKVMGYFELASPTTDIK